MKTLANSCDNDYNIADAGTNQIVYITKNVAMTDKISNRDCWTER